MIKEKPNISIEDPFVPENVPDVHFNHLPVLDGLRGFAVLVVMIYHLEYLFPSLNMFVRGGFLGVDIFFVLSGFLITSILIKEQSLFGQINLKNFFLRRIFRLVPAFWAFLFILYFFGNFLLPSAQAGVIYDNNNFGFSFLYLMNWHRAYGDGITGNLNHTWSLAIEEQFYIVWSLILFALFAAKKSRVRIAGFTVATVLVLISWRLFRALNGEEIHVLYYSTETRIDALLIGCVGAMVYGWKLIPQSFYKSRKFRITAFWAFIAAFMILFAVSHEDASLFYGLLSAFSVSVSIIIIWLITNEGLLKRILEVSVLRWVGKISYALYLWHYLCYEFAKKSFDSIPLEMVFGISLAVSISIASYILIEKPFLKLKNRYTN